MKLGNNLHLTYCSNIHPGESWQEVSDALTSALPRVRALLAHDGPMAIGLRLSARAAETLSDTPALEDFRSFLADGNYYVPTINGFPYGQFHGTRVKEQVYLPDWRSPARLAYTNRLADLLATLLSDRSDIEGSISTVPGGFRTTVTSKADEAAIASGMLRHAAHLTRVRSETGVTIALAIEPEPACFLETVDDVLAFFEGHLFDAASVAAAAGDAALPLEMEDVRRHVGVCLDACHMAVEFEDPAAAIERVTQAGIRISKVQLSSALRFRNLDDPANLAALETFADDTYLHQVVQRRAVGLIRFPDLPFALSAARAEPPAPDEEWRVHFHVPIFIERVGQFQTTQPYLARVLGLISSGSVCRCLEVETYTWDVLPAEFRKDDLCAAIARELDWVRSTLNA